MRLAVLACTLIAMASLLAKNDTAAQITQSVRSPIS